MGKQEEFIVLGSGSPKARFGHSVKKGVVPTPKTLIDQGVEQSFKPKSLQDL